jgi:hypothetical protein
LRDSAGHLNGGIVRHWKQNPRALANNSLDFAATACRDASYDKNSVAKNSCQSEEDFSVHARNLFLGRKLMGPLNCELRFARKSGQKIRNN